MSKDARLLKLSTYLPPAEAARVAELAERNDRSVAAELRIAIRRHLDLIARARRR